MRTSYRFSGFVCIVLLLILSAFGSYSDTQAAATKTPTPIPPSASVGTLAVLVYQSGGNLLYLMDTDGKNFKQVDVSSKPNTPDLAWSPDGNHLAFINQNCQATVINPDGSSPQIVKAVGRGFAWTPDSKQLTFEQNGQVTSVDVTTGQPSPVIMLKKNEGDL